MLFGKLLPKEGNFFELFNQHAERTVEAARAFSNLVANYGDIHLREKIQPRCGQRRARRRPRDPGSQPPDPHHLHHTDRP